METNELPEDVKRKIEEVVELEMPNEFWSSYARNQYKKGIEVGYRLGLQSEEELTRLKDACNGLDRNITRISEENEALKKERESRADTKRLRN